MLLMQNKFTLKILSTSRPASAHTEHILHSMHCHFNCLTADASSGENFRQLGWPVYQDTNNAMYLPATYSMAQNTDKSASFQKQSKFYYEIV